MSVLTMKRTAVSPGIGGHARRHNAVSLGDSPTVLCLRALGDLEEHEEATRHYIQRTAASPGSDGWNPES